jgi:hypothetical protein
MEYFNLQQAGDNTIIAYLLYPVQKHWNWRFGCPRR